MKITTVRALLIAADLGLFAAVGAVVWTGVSEKQDRPRQTMRFLSALEARLEAARPEGVLAAPRVSYGDRIKTVNISGYAEVEAPAPAPAPPTPLEESRPPLESVLKVVGIELVDSPTLRSRVLVAKEGPVALRSDEPRYFEEGSAIPWAFGAVVKRVEANLVVFDYAGTEVPLVPKAAPSPSGVVSAAGSRVPPQPSEDTGTWLQIDPQRPANVEITPVGMVSITRKGEDVLEGVRWSSEILDDGRAAMRIEEVPASSVLARGGAQVGDVLVSINGNRVTNMPEVMDYVKRNPDLSRYEVVFLRRGVRNVRIVSVPRR